MSFKVNIVYTTQTIIDQSLKARSISNATIMAREGMSRVLVGKRKIEKRTLKYKPHKVELLVH